MSYLTIYAYYFIFILVYHLYVYKAGTTLFMGTLSNADATYFFIHCIVIFILTFLGWHLARLRIYQNISFPKIRVRAQVIRTRKFRSLKKIFILLTLVVNASVAFILFKNNGYVFGHYSQFPLSRGVVMIMSCFQILTLFEARKCRKRHVLIALIAISPFLVDSSRFAAVLAGLAFYQSIIKRAYITSVFYSVLTVSVYFLAILGRGGAALTIVLEALISMISSGDIYLLIALDLYTTTTYAFEAAIHMQETLLERALKFVVYLSPIPSNLFINESFYKYVSFNEYLGISYDTIGLNADFFSEPVNWFGVPGAYFFYIFNGLFWRTIYDYRSNLVIHKKSQKLFLLDASFIYYLALGLLASLRASSRPITYFLVVSFLLMIIRQTYGSRNSYNR